MRILCVGRRNTCRSPMFANVFQRELTDVVGGASLSIESAGLLQSAKGEVADPLWLELQSETGIDLRAHRSRWIGDVLIPKVEIIFCMDPDVFDAASKLALPSRVSVYLINGPKGIPYPAPRSLMDYRRCYVQICTSALRWVPSQSR